MIIYVDVTNIQYSNRIETTSIYIYCDYQRVCLSKDGPKKMDAVFNVLRVNIL